jgi:dTDP-4-amino-4,6-dideoxygalactose transaminase
MIGERVFISAVISVYRSALLIRHLAAHEISSFFHYLPLRLSPVGIQSGGKHGDCPTTEDVSARLLRLHGIEQASAVAPLKSCNQWTTRRPRGSTA